jgi:hypothetical protein
MLNIIVALHLLVFILHPSYSQDIDIIMMSWKGGAEEGISIINDGVLNKNIDIPQLPVAQHQTFFRITSKNRHNVEKMVLGLNLRALPLTSDGEEHKETSDTSKNSNEQLLVDIKKPPTTSIASVGDHYEAIVEITYICGGKPGHYVVLGTVPKSGSSDSDVSIFKWKKICSNGLLYGFNVYTSDNDPVILNGDVVSSYRKVHPGSSRTEDPRKIGYMQDKLNFIISGPASTDAYATKQVNHFSLGFNITALRMKPLPKFAGLSVVLEGPAASGGYLEAGDKVELSLIFDCILTGTTTIELDFTVSENRHLVSTISFQKECHVGPLPGFDIIPSGIQSLEFLVVKDGQARPSYAKNAPLAIVGPTETTVDFDIFVKDGLEIPIKAVWAKTVDFEVQRNPTTDDKTWFFNKNNHPKKPTFSHPGRGSIFGSTGSILDSLTKKLFDRHAVPASRFIMPSSNVFDGLNGLFQRFKGGNGGNGGNRRLWKSNERDEPAVIPRQNDKIQRASIVAKASVSGTATMSSISSKDPYYPWQSTRMNKNPKTMVFPTVTSNKPLSLSVTHDCLHSGSVVVTVNLLVVPQNAKIKDEEQEEDNEKNNGLGKFMRQALKDVYKKSQQKIVSFSYVKECLVGSIPGLDISMGNYQPRKRMGGYALFHGLVTSSFMSKGFQKTVVREGELTSNFYVSLNNPQWIVVLKNVTLKVTHGSEILDSDISVLSASGAKISTWKPHEPIVIQGSRYDMLPRILHVNYNCLKSGQARMSMTLSMTPIHNGEEQKERAFTLAWDKQCRVPPLKGLMVNINSLANEEKSISKYFHVIDHGFPTTSFQPGIHDASVGKRWNSVHFEISMVENATMPIARPFVVSNNQLTEPNLNVFLDGKMIQQKGELHDDTTFYMQHNHKFSMDLNFNCASSMNGSSIVTVVIPLRPPIKQYTSTAVKYPVDVSFSLTKRCGNVHSKFKKKLWEFLQSPSGITLVVSFLVGMAICMGVCFFPEKIVNWRAKLLRGNYKYKRVKLEDNEDDLNEGSHMLEREGDAST